jgi:hypothetical protein
MSALFPIPQAVDPTSSQDTPHPGQGRGRRTPSPEELLDGLNEPQRAAVVRGSPLGRGGAGSGRRGC